MTTSHTHCFEKENPPCGLPGKHRCCLCNEPVPHTEEETLREKWKDYMLSKKGQEISEKEIADFFLSHRQNLLEKIEGEIGEDEEYERLDMEASPEKERYLRRVNMNKMTINSERSRIRQLLNKYKQ